MWAQFRAIREDFLKQIFFLTIEKNVFDFLIIQIIYIKKQ